MFKMFDRSPFEGNKQTIKQHAAKHTPRLINPARLKHLTKPHNTTQPSHTTTIQHRKSTIKRYSGGGDCGGEFGGAAGGAA